MKYYGLTKCIRNDKIILIKVSDNLDIEFSLSISMDMQVALTKEGIKVQPIVGFSWKLTKWSTIEALIEYLLQYDITLDNKVHHFGSQLKELGEQNSSDHSIFLGEQLFQFNKDPKSRRFNSKMLLNSLKLYLLGRSTYKRLRELSDLPQSQLIESYFGSSHHVLSNKNFLELVDKGVNSLKHKFVVILFDEVYVQPSIRYRGGHIIGRSIDPYKDY